jgi:hypothetical protein
VAFPSESVITGITIAGRTRGGLSLFADVQGEFNGTQTGVGLLLGMRKNWSYPSSETAKLPRQRTFLFSFGLS